MNIDIVTISVTIISFIASIITIYEFFNGIFKK